MTARVLGEARSPKLAASIGHAYADKYALVEAQLSALAVSTVHVLEAAGLTRDALRTIAWWAAAGSSVTLRFNASTLVTFVREDTRDVEDPTRKTTTLGGLGLTSRTYTKVTDYVWRFDAAWAIDVYRGTGRGAGDAQLLTSRTSGQAELLTKTKNPPAFPFADGAQSQSVETQLTFLAAAVDGNDTALPVRVTIDRAAPSCRTPRRNAVSDSALRFSTGLYDWAHSVENFLTRVLPEVARQASLASATPNPPDVQRWTAAGLFVPALLFEEPAAGEGVGGGGQQPGSDGVDTQEATVDSRGGVSPSPAPTNVFNNRQQDGITSIRNLAASTSPPPPSNGTTARPSSSSKLMDLSSVNRLLVEGRASLRARIAAVAKAQPSPSSSELLSSSEATVAIACAYAQRIALHATDGVNYVEGMLRDQVVAAVGKVRRAAE